MKLCKNDVKISYIPRLKKTVKEAYLFGHHIPWPRSKMHKLTNQGLDVLKITIL